MLTAQALHAAVQKAAAIESDVYKGQKTKMHVYVLGRAKFLIDKLSAGKYEVRYQNIMIGESRGECVNGRRTPLRQAAARQPGA